MRHTHHNIDLGSIHTFADTVIERFTTERFETEDDEVQFLAEAMHAIRHAIEEDSQDMLEEVGVKYLHLGQS